MITPHIIQGGIFIKNKKFVYLKKPDYLYHIERLCESKKIKEIKRNNSDKAFFDENIRILTIPKNIKNRDLAFLLLRLK